MVKLLMETIDNYSAWDLFRRGQIDQRKHLKIIERMIKENITDLISHGKIIAGDNVVIPVKSLKQYKFMYAPNEEGTAVIPDASKKEKGDIISEKPKQGQPGGEGEGGGDGEGGGGHYEVVVNADKIAEYLFENMELPRLKRKSPKDVFKEEYKVDSISKRGSINNLQKKRTVYENIKRNASKGDPSFKGIVDDDLRFRSHSIKKVPQDKIVAIFIRDRSASMDEYKKEMTRIASFWFNQFLEWKYSKVIDKKFILFDTKGVKVNEDEFYSLSEGGGTRISSGLDIAKDMIDKEYPSSMYNIYVFIYSDGDNFPDDTNDASKLLTDISVETNLTGFCHIRNNNSIYSNFYSGESDFVKRVKVMAKDQEEVEFGRIEEQKDIIEIMKQFFGGEEK